MAIRRQYPYPVRPPGPWNPPELPVPLKGPGTDWYPEQSRQPYRLPDETARGMDELLRGVNPPQYPTRPVGWNPPALPTPPNGPGVDWYPEQSQQPPIRTPPSALSVPQSERYGAPMEPPSVPEWQPPQRLAEEEVRAAFYPYPRQPAQQPTMAGAPAPAGSGQSYYDKRALENRGYTPQQAVAGMQAGRGAPQAAMGGAPVSFQTDPYYLKRAAEKAGYPPPAERSSATVPMPSVADIQGAQRKGQEFAENLRADMSMAPNFGWGNPPPVTAEQVRTQGNEPLRRASFGFPAAGELGTSAPAAQEILALRGGMNRGMGSPASDVRTAPPAMWQPDMGTVPRGAEFVKQREERLAKEKQLSDFLGARQLPYRPLGSVSETGGVPASDTAQAELARLARYSGNPQVETPGKMSFADYKKMAQTSAPFAETQATLPTWVGQGGTRIVDQKKYEDSQKRRQDTESQRALNLRANKRGVAPWQQQAGETMAKGGTLTEDQRMGAFPGYIQGQNEAAQRQTWERVMSEQSRSRANAGKFESLARAYGMAATPEARKGIMDLMNALDQPPGTTAAPPGNNITPAPGATKPAVPIATAIETMRNMGMTPEQMREQLPTMGYSLADVQGQTGFNILPWAMGLNPFNPAGLSGQGLISKMLPEQTAQSILEAFPEWLSPAKETRRRKTAQAILKGSK